MRVLCFKTARNYIYVYSYFISLSLFIYIIRRYILTTFTKITQNTTSMVYNWTSASVQHINHKFTPLAFKTNSNFIHTGVDFDFQPELKSTPTQVFFFFIHLPLTRRPHALFFYFFTLFYCAFMLLFFFFSKLPYTHFSWNSQQIC